MAKNKKGLGVFEFAIFIASIAIVLLFFIVKIAKINVESALGNEYIKAVRFLDLIKGFKLSVNSSYIDLKFSILDEKFFYFIFIIPIVIGILVFLPKHFDKIVILIDIILSTAGALLTMYAFRFLKGIETLENSTISIGSSEIEFSSISVEYSIFLYVIMFLYLGILAVNVIRYFFRR